MASNHIPGQYPESINTQSHPMAGFGSAELDPSDWREGKFSDLGTFLDAEEATIANFEHRPAKSAGIRPGSIIHIHDQNPESRIHDRVLLVKSTNSYCMICFSFCRHRPCIMESDAPIHWRAVAKGKPYQKDHPLGLGALEMYLPYGLSPHEEVTINLRDPWNVEWDVSVAKLGEVTGDAWAEVRKEMIKIFTFDQHFSDHMTVSTSLNRPLSNEEQSGTSKSPRQSKRTGPSPKSSPHQKQRRVSSHGKWGPLF